MSKVDAVGITTSHVDLTTTRIADTVDVTHTYALDADSPLSTLVLRASGTSARAVDRRSTWRAVGVLDDELSSAVLAAGIDAAGSSVADRICRVGVAAGQAVSLTVAAIRTSAPVLPGPRDVFVVENPEILSMASTALGARIAPMVCVSGWPSGAAIELLVGLGPQRHALRHHGRSRRRGRADRGVRVRRTTGVSGRSPRRIWRVTVPDRAPWVIA